MNDYIMHNTMALQRLIGTPKRVSVAVDRVYHVTRLSQQLS